MVNILDIEPKYFLINGLKGCKDGSVLFDLRYSDEAGVTHIVFNNIECIFRRSGLFSYLIFCESNKNKIMLDHYVKIIDQLEKEVLSFADEFEEDQIFNLGADFMRFRFSTDDNLVYNEKINIPVCVISLSSVNKKGDTYYPQL